MLWIILAILLLPFVIIFPVMVLSGRADEQSERQLNERKKK
ncbi:hypothetical protein [Virgibacillus siamensis]|nr:hypothetical protein [Virgibacillus siamensis]